MEHKSLPITEFKADATETPGTFEAVVAVFGNVDHGGDRMVKGAFARTLKERGMPPVVWSHKWGEPPIGIVGEAAETDEGLHIKGRLFIDDNARAREVYRAMADGALKEFSFGYEARVADDVTEDGKAIRELKDVDLFEVGPTLVGMNPATRLVGVKSTDIADAVRDALDNPTSPSSTTGPEDNPAPNSAPADEEAQARIRRLLADKPIHV